jgi:ubiquitin-protein ligase
MSTEYATSSKSVFFEKRIMREIEKVGALEHITVDEVSLDKYNNYCIRVTDLLYSSYNTYNLYLQYYPFRPPNVDICGVMYSEFLKMNSHLFVSKLKETYGIDCLFCNSILCPNNWGALVSLNSIIEEIRKFKSYRRDIINVLLAEKIKCKYLIDDIDIASWLVKTK